MLTDLIAHLQRSLSSFSKEECSNKLLLWLSLAYELSLPLVVKACQKVIAQILHMYHREIDFTTLIAYLDTLDHSKREIAIELGSTNKECFGSLYAVKKVHTLWNNVEGDLCITLEHCITKKCIALPLGPALISMNRSLPQHLQHYYQFPTIESYFASMVSLISSYDGTKLAIEDNKGFMSIYSFDISLHTLSESYQVPSTTSLLYCNLSIIIDMLALPAHTYKLKTMKFNISGSKLLLYLENTANNITMVIWDLLDDVFFLPSEDSIGSEFNQEEFFANQSITTILTTIKKRQILKTLLEQQQKLQEQWAML